MRLTLTVLLALCLLLTQGAALAEDTQEERSFDGKVLATMEIEASAEECYYFFTKLLNIPIEDFVCYPTQNEALFALKSGKIDTILSMDASAEYIAAQDDTLITYMDPRLKDYASIALSMVVMAQKHELGERLNEAIATLREDGTLDKLTMTMLGGAAPELPEPAEKTGEVLYIGVSGDIPPVDYVNEMGEPAGYNVALTTAVAGILGCDVEYVQLNKSAFVTALATGKIDVAFWQEQSLSEEMRAILGAFSNQIFITDPYLTLDITAIELRERG